MTAGGPLAHLFTAIVSTVPEAAVEYVRQSGFQWLEAAGEERLRLKAERLALAMQNKEPEQVLWEELMAALGYKNNKAPFRKLATTL
ncbi:DUF2851 family protein, partial [Pontiellaceae bacterium B12227]|nr:DUF2851 family protein [Pontiellaceae bacterium B12227]